MSNFIKVYALNMCNLLYVDYSSIKLHKKPKCIKNKLDIAEEKIRFEDIIHIHSREIKRGTCYNETRL